MKKFWMVISRGEENWIWECHTGNFKVTGNVHR